MKGFSVEIWSGELFGDGGLLSREQVDNHNQGRVRERPRERLPDEIALEERKKRGHGSMGMDVKGSEDKDGGARLVLAVTMAAGWAAGRIESFHIISPDQHATVGYASPHLEPHDTISVTITTQVLVSSEHP